MIWQSHRERVPLKREWYERRQLEVTMRRLLIFLSASVVVVGSVGVCQAGTVHVPGDQPTIQLGIGSASSGDTVLIAPGTYTETLDFHGKAVTVGGRYLITGNPASIDSTVIEGGGVRGPLVTFDTGEDSLSVLAGLTLQHGYASRGAGVLCDLSSPRIVGCVFRSNEAQDDGGGIYADEAGPIIELCVFDDNTAVNHSGGGFAVRNGWPRIAGCVFTGNDAHDEGGAIFSEESSAVILDNVIDGNTSAVTYAGGVMSRNCESVIARNAFTNNHTYGHGGGLFY